LKSVRWGDLIHPHQNGESNGFGLVAETEQEYQERAKTKGAEEDHH
jgi:hypothetical protein